MQYNTSLVLDCSIPIPYALEILQYGTKPLMYVINVIWLAQTHPKVIDFGFHLTWLANPWLGGMLSLWHPIPSVLQHKAMSQKHLVTRRLQIRNLIPQSDLQVSSYWHHATIYHWLSSEVLEQTLCGFKSYRLWIIYLVQENIYESEWDIQSL